MDRALSTQEKNIYRAQQPRKRKKRRNKLEFLLILLLTLVVESLITDNTTSADSPQYLLAPAPDQFRNPVIQVYSARTRGPKGVFADHCWVATKRKGADHYLLHQVIGWRRSADGNKVFTEPGIPDRGWYGNDAVLHLDLRGEQYESVIDQIEAAVGSYPWGHDYHVYPGPNSNTFVSWIGREVPALALDLPSNAIGKDWRPLEEGVGISTSGTGLQASLLGFTGITLGYEEGIEINLLGLSFELDLFDLAFELPVFGRYHLGLLFLVVVGWVSYRMMLSKRFFSRLIRG